MRKMCYKREECNSMIRATMSFSPACSQRLCEDTKRKKELFPPPTLLHVKKLVTYSVFLNEWSIVFQLLKLSFI